MTLGYYAACNSAGELCTDASSSLGVETTSDGMVPNGHHQPSNEYSDETVSLMSSMHLSEQTMDGNLQSLQSFASESKYSLFSNLVPEPVVNEEPVELLMVPQPVDCLARRNFYPPHWSPHAISKGLEVSLIFNNLCDICEAKYHSITGISVMMLFFVHVQKGELLRAVFRVNPYNRLEVCGVTYFLFISYMLYIKCEP